MRRRSGVKVAVLQEMKAAGVRTYILEKKQVGEAELGGEGRGAERCPGEPPAAAALYATL